MSKNIYISYRVKCSAQMLLNISKQIPLLINLFNSFAFHSLCIGWFFLASLLLARSPRTGLTIRSVSEPSERNWTCIAEIFISILHYIWGQSACLSFTTADRMCRQSLLALLQDNWLMTTAHSLKSPSISSSHKQEHRHIYAIYTLAYLVFLCAFFSINLTHTCTHSARESYFTLWVIAFLDFCWKCNHCKK